MGFSDSQMADKERTHDFYWNLAEDHKSSANNLLDHLEHRSLELQAQQALWDGVLQNHFRHFVMADAENILEEKLFKHFRQCQEQGQDSVDIDQLLAIIEYAKKVKENTPTSFKLDDGVFLDEHHYNKALLHQLEGIKFIYERLIGSLADVDRNTGHGGILNHCMGMGKTFQVIAFITAICRNETLRKKFKRIAVFCPAGLISTWEKEFTLRCPAESRPFQVLTVSTSNKSAIHYWYNSETPCVLILGYDRYRTFVSNNDDGVFYKYLGKKSQLTKIITNTKTERRLGITGTIFQNNLEEYRCCVGFTYPNLGTEKRFKELFSDHIEAGQTKDATDEQRQMMNERSYVLHSLNEKHVHRRHHDPAVMPPRRDFVIFMRLSAKQRTLYGHHVQSLVEKKIKGSYLMNYHLLRRMWTHPYLLINASKNHSDEYGYPNESVQKFIENGFVCHEDEYIIELSYKLLFVLSLIKKCEEKGEKLLIFSQHLDTIGLLKRTLQNIKNWKEGENFYTISGFVESVEREQYADVFNKSSSNVRLVIVSTKAGCCGLNLQGASRVVIFDVSPNPSNDEQATYRTYRLGQEKAVYVYRLVAQATLEERDYKRQIAKISTGRRVEDQSQIESEFTEKELKDLYSNFRPNIYDPSLPALPHSDDTMLNDVLADVPEAVVEWKNHELHFAHHPEFELTDEEKKAAEASYVAESSSMDERY
ncbi:hypothetical protein QR680_010839 [Steinernema hermaphroditum]|uniref:Helicase C-terminal domain-containing protein n=1 Tax=Steinernema hermaphroditum TaxID=289476 RepID=A0AA39IRS4_9BILA|nr:hypothetical protein QR680_010839 [Steinernema hermaphroditum]